MNDDYINELSMLEKTVFLKLFCKMIKADSTVDNDEIDCSSYQLVLMLNIPFFCGGGNPIGVHFGYKQCCDKEIEVVGFTSIPHVILSKVRRIS